MANYQPEMSTIILVKRGAEVACGVVSDRHTAYTLLAVIANTPNCSTIKIVVSEILKRGLCVSICS